MLAEDLIKLLEKANEGHIKQGFGPLEVYICKYELEDEHAHCWHHTGISKDISLKYTECGTLAVLDTK